MEDCKILRLFMFLESEQALDNYLENIQNRGLSYNGYMSIKGCFIWIESKQGQQYWDGLHLKWKEFLNQGELERRRIRDKYVIDLKGGLQVDESKLGCDEKVNTKYRISTKSSVTQKEIDDLVRTSKNIDLVYFGFVTLVIFLGVLGIFAA